MARESTPADLQLKETLIARVAMRAEIPHGMHYSCVEDLLLKHGTFWDPHPLADRWREAIEAWPKACFDNSYRLARKSRGQLRYVEGVAFGVIPVEHAWCVDKEGRVVDITWGSFRTIGIGTSYMGVVIPLDVVRLYRSKHNTSALHHWQGRYPLLQKPFGFPQGNILPPTHV